MKKLISIASAIALSTSLSGAYTAEYTSNISSITACAAEEATTGIDDILPTTSGEWDDFVDKYGTMSVHGKYIVFCDDFGDTEGIDELTFRYTGDSYIEDVKNYVVDCVETPDLDEYYNRYVFVCEAKRSGVGKAEFVRNSPKYNNTWTIWSDNFCVNSDLTISTRANCANGDANCDGKVTVADAAAILQYLGNGDKYPLSPEGKLFADALDPGDGVTTADAMAIQKNILGLIDMLPAHHYFDWDEETGEEVEVYEEYTVYFSPDSYGKYSGGFMLSLSTPPEKTVYKIGEELDLTGAVVTGSGGTMGINIDIFGEKLELDNGRFIYDTSEFDNTKPGEYTIRVYFDPSNYPSIDFNYNYPAEITVTVVEG